MDSDTKKLLNWQKRVIETMYENPGNLHAYITQKKWDELKQEAEEMQAALQPRSWVVEMYEYHDGSILIARGPSQPTLNPNGWTLRGRGVIVEGEGLDNVST